MAGLIVFTSINDAVIIGLIGCLLTLIITTLTLRPLRKWLIKKGKTGIDVHKSSKPEIPEMGGVAVLIGVEAAIMLLSVLFPALFFPMLIFGLSIGIGGIVGVLDDLFQLKAWQKPLLTMIASIPILLTTSYTALVLPIVGPTRLTVVYPFIIPIAFAVCTNTTNMIDVFNGTMSGNFTIVFITLMVASVFVSSQLGFLGAALLCGATLGLFLLNRFPSKIFCGDTGALTIGSGLATLVIMGGIEVIAVIAILPFIMNAFHSLASVRGLFERHDMKHRPIQMDADSLLSANPDKAAPLTLTRLLLSKGPLTELQIIKDMMYLTIASCILAMITSGMFVSDILWIIGLLGLGGLSVILGIRILPRETREIVLVIGIVWMSAIFGFWVVDTWIVVLPDPVGLLPQLLSQIMKISITGILSLIWLFVWNQSVKTIFWRNIGHHQIEKK